MALVFPTAFNNALQNIIINFSALPNVGEDIAKTLIATINKSPELVSGFNVEATNANPMFTAFGILTGGDAGATYNSGDKSIRLVLDTIAKANTDVRIQSSLIYQLGHELQHSKNSHATNAAHATFLADMRVQNQAGNTNFTLIYQN